MAAVIKSLLVGIGFKPDQKGARQVTSTLDGIQRKALQLGTVLGGAFGFNQLTSGFATANDTLGKFVELYGGTADEVAALGRVFQHEGGNLNEVLSSITKIAALRDSVLAGNAEVAELAKFGISSDEIRGAETAYDALLLVLERINKMSPAAQRNAMNAIGLSEGGTRVAIEGGIRGRIADEQGRLKITAEDLRISAEFNDQFQDLMTNMKQLGAYISAEILPPINEFLDKTNKFLEGDNPLSVLSTTKGKLQRSDLSGEDAAIWNAYLGSRITSQGSTASPLTPDLLNSLRTEQRKAQLKETQKRGGPDAIQNHINLYIDGKWVAVRVEEEIQKAVNQTKSGDEG